MVGKMISGREKRREFEELGPILSKDIHFGISGIGIAVLG
jgi:hypothetical protein